MDYNFSDDLKLVNELLFSKLNFELKNIEQEKESSTYAACTFDLNGFKILYREAKITPTKIGLFVTIWKRNNDVVTKPFDVKDDIDFVIISCRVGNNFGLFVFPKKVLGEKKIFTQNSIGGKRGIRVYPPWSKTENKQAKQTQAWQVEYFLEMNDNIDVEKAKNFIR
jgi:hypothetical protein